MQSKSRIVGKSDRVCLGEAQTCDRKCRPDVVRPDCYKMYRLGIDRCEDITDPAQLKLTGCDAVLRQQATMRAEDAPPATGCRPAAGRPVTSSRKCKR